MKTFCGLDCCEKCERISECGGCEKCGGHPFGGKCIAAEAVRAGGIDAFKKLESTLVNEINALNIPQLHVDGLNLLNGFYVNLEYPLANGETVKFLNDASIYLGNQIERESGGRCYGVVADEGFILVCEYGFGGANPELVLYKRR